MRTFVLYDLEFTSWEGALAQDWGGEGQFREIVQIGALRVREDLSVVAEYEVLVRPVMNPRLSPFFEELTGIEQRVLDAEGVPPARALSDFLGFCEGRSAFSYGNDMVVLGENIGWARARGETVTPSCFGAHFSTLRPWLHAVAPATVTANSGRLWQALGLPRPAAEGAEHSALFDCYSLAAALRHLRERGTALPEALLGPGVDRGIG
ncbi:exonuclease domain-containing protein [Streptomyces sp. J2-1]|uniref:3'-5' exonuclease n=1 Tax=Streptomyces corallincola TaxID=2851888 RepID=UPI001C39599C|nr:3'-5' exonuclease [Streptomyces corallincola]MBV2353744.1 exonuclease domain-containing protein [Streptomyces corallincola]